MCPKQPHTDSKKPLQLLSHLDITTKDEERPGFKAGNLDLINKVMCTNYNTILQMVLEKISHGC